MTIYVNYFSDEVSVYSYNDTGENDLDMGIKRALEAILNPGLILDYLDDATISKWVRFQLNNIDYGHQAIEIRINDRPIKVPPPGPITPLTKIKARAYTDGDGATHYDLNDPDGPPLINDIVNAVIAELARRATSA